MKAIEPSKQLLLRARLAGQAWRSRLLQVTQTMFVASLSVRCADPCPSMPWCSSAPHALGPPELVQERREGQRQRPPFAQLQAISQVVRGRPQTDYRADGWQRLGWGAIRGATIGPIESSAHPGVGYGTSASNQTVAELRALGCNWIAITPFGRQWDLQHTEIQLDFEAPFASNRLAILRMVAQAHEQGLRVLLVPHLWIERPGLWRGEIDPGTDARWQQWFASYTRFVTTWAAVAEESGVEMLSIGVEMKSSSATRVSDWHHVIDAIRARYHGLLTYSANWDEETQVGFWDRLDLVGINAFYPLADNPGATIAELRQGARARADRLGAWAQREGRPIFFTEFGYTARPDPAVRPWEWPDDMRGVVVDEHAQAVAYRALLEAFAPRPWFAGAMVWRYYADPMDASQEASHGFCPRLREAEDVLKQLYALRWGADPQLDTYTLAAYRIGTSEL
jgi:hypothetical protein